MRARFNKASVSENVAELIRQAACVLRARRTREDVSIGIVACRKRGQVIAERLQKREDDSLSCFACCERNLASLKIDGTPREASQITETLAGVESEKQKAAPLHVMDARFQNPFDFCECERAALGFLGRFEQFHAHAWIHCEQFLPHRFPETDSQNFEA